MTPQTVSQSELSSVLSRFVRSKQTTFEVRVSLGTRGQTIRIDDIRDGESRILRLTTKVMPITRALETLLLAMPKTTAIIDEGDDESSEAEGAVSSTLRDATGARILAMLAHNGRLRGAHLHLGAHELEACSDLVCLDGQVDLDVLCHRVWRLAITADGMERRVMGEGEEHDLR